MICRSGNDVFSKNRIDAPLAHRISLRYGLVRLVPVRRSNRFTVMAKGIREYE